MVEIVEIDLEALGPKVPSGSVGIVTLQPFLTMGASEPHRIIHERRPQTLDAIARTLDIAQLADHGAAVTHFTILPEYSVPGLDGVRLVDERLHDGLWPPGTIVIAGIDGLDKDEYGALCGARRTTVDERNSPNNVRRDEWVNCCVTWVKTAAGEIHRWVQPKLSPAWEEKNIQHRRMFGGSSIFLFRCLFDNGAPCRFFSLICFDWVGRTASDTVLRDILSNLNVRSADNILLNWVFVLQRTSEPSHPSFLNAINHFFLPQNEFPKVRREQTGLLFVNSAGRPEPGRSVSFGDSGVIFSPVAPLSIGDACHLTYCSRPARRRSSETIKRCKDVLFRERGACIHSFAQRVAAFVVPDATGRSLPVSPARVYPVVIKTPADPRAAGHEVAGCVKWVNDTLDDLACLSRLRAGVALTRAVEGTHAINVAGMRRIDSQQLEKAICDAIATQKDQGQNADTWSDDEATAFETVVHTLDILRLGFPILDLIDTAGHATLTARSEVIDVVAVTGDSHDRCLEHVLKRVRFPARHRALVVSRDPLNRPRLRKEGKVYTSTGSQEGKLKYTDPDSAVTHVAFSDLLSAFESATTGVHVEEWLHASIDA